MKSTFIFIVIFITPLIQAIWICPGKKIGDVMTKDMSSFASYQEAQEWCGESAYYIETDPAEKTKR